MQETLGVVRPPERLSGQHDCAADQQNGHVPDDRELSGGAMRQLPAQPGAGAAVPAGAEPSARSRTARPRPERWAVTALIKADTIEHRMQMALLGHRNDASCHATARAVARLINTARDACQGRRGPLDRWWGTSLERAYQSLHAAETLLVDLASLDEVDAAVGRVRARVMTALESGDPRRSDAEELARLPRGPVKRLRLKNAMAASYAAADQAHVRLRDFRNVVWVTTVLIVMLIGALVFLVSKNPSMVPFCFTPAGDHRVCPTGRAGPSGVDVILIAGLGLLGGALAAAFAIRNIRGTSTPYDIPIALAALKVPTGALTAVAGLLLLRGQFVPGLSALDSQQQILAYALVLGYAQQLFTRLVDRQAQSILDGVPSKETQAGQPMPAPAPAAAAMPLAPQVAMPPSASSADASETRDAPRPEG
jgi:hypothetical protein